MEKELKIIVAGCAMQGKSSMMYYLEQLLIKEGFTVELSFEHNFDYADANDFREIMSLNVDERQKTLKENTKIILMDRQLMRNGKENTKRIEDQQGYKTRFKASNTTKN